MSSESEIVPVLNSAGSWSSVVQAPLTRPFDVSLVTFASELSSNLLGDARVRRHPELVALAFWMRPANLTRMIEQFQSKSQDSVLLPRGTVLHIAPANVDTIFAYSWLISLLCGNRNIVRLSNRSTPQLELLLQSIDACLAESRHGRIASSVAVVRYEHSDEINRLLSAECDTRVIWGGDDTVRAIRTAILRPTANEVTFANKLSMCLINSEFWANAEPHERKQLAHRFASDAYQFGQAACSSPRIVVWQGKSANASTTDAFWRYVAEASADLSDNLEEVDFVNKLVAACRAAVAVPVKVLPSQDNRLTRISFQHDRLQDILQADVHCGGGIFYETTIQSLEELLPSMSRVIQTVTYAGFKTEDLRTFLTEEVCQGIDRIVPIGQALEFSPVWDGFDLFETFLRHVTLT